MVELWVSKPDPKLYRVHKKLLCETIPYFKNMFKGGFKEATDNKATFPEDSPESFGMLEWVYTGKLRLSVVIEWDIKI